MTKVWHEADYMRALMSRASSELPHVRLFRRNVGMTSVGGRTFRSGIKGQCDLYVLARGGWYGEVELKRYTKLSEDQERWRDWCNQWGVPWVCLSVSKGEEPAATLARWCGELRQFVPGAVCQDVPSGDVKARVKVGKPLEFRAGDGDLVLDRDEE